MNTPIDPKRILIVPVKSRYMQEREKFEGEGVPGDDIEIAMRSLFPSETLWQNVIDGHRTQQQNIERLIATYPEAAVVDRSLLSTVAGSFDCFMIPGGDEHFKYCAQELLVHPRVLDNPDASIMGIKLDPSRSVGALLAYTVDDMATVRKELLEGTYHTTLWTTLDARVEGARTEYAYPSISECLVAKYARPKMSRFVAAIDGKTIGPEDGKSSGVLVALGNGTYDHAWFANLRASAGLQPERMEANARDAYILFTETTDTNAYRLTEGEVLTLDSYNNHKTIIAPDGHDEGHETNVPFGARVYITISPQQLRVIGSAK